MDRRQVATGMKGGTRKDTFGEENSEVVRMKAVAVLWTSHQKTTSCLLSVDNSLPGAAGQEKRVWVDSGTVLLHKIVELICDPIVSSQVL